MRLSSTTSHPSTTRRLAKAAATALAGAAVVLTAAGCSPSVEISAATGSADPACAPMMVALPDTLGDAAKRSTTSQGTAAWGDPSLVILRCGVNVPGPTTDRCVGVNGVDWVLKEGDPTWTLTTYGRTPATELVFDPNKIASSTVLAEIANAAAKIPATRGCVSPEDAVKVPTS
ncbi:DUF3515 family protein [Arthrobacter sp. 35W]|uniref:DUF3515 family protein n=1 Tax=Arthrobacter sp. 35W TaxID=1132441 RepID=UPI00040A3D99|nr:DUF3515 family protein [Arthrobacter sp. 35W]